MKSLNEIRTSRSAKRLPRTKSAKPKKPSQNYLNMYVLTTEKERLEKELKIVDRRRIELIMRINDVSKELKEIETKIGDLKKSGELKTDAPELPIDSKQWKKFSMNY
jgi:predicted  nucleic acid-binding Zn-ribbon protein